MGFVASKTFLIWEDPKTFQTKFIRFDVVTLETHEALMNITSHPVEAGSDVVDHARPEPERISIEAFVSNTPLYSNPGVEKLMDYGPMKLVYPEKPGAFIPTPGALTQAAVGFVEGLLGGGLPKKVTVLKPKGDMPNRARKMFEDLSKAKNERALLRVISAIEELDNMMIERVAVPRTPEDSGGAVFQLDLRRVRIVQSLTVKAPVPAEVRGAQAAAKGSKATKEDAKKDEKLKSIGAATVDGVGNAVGGALKAVGY